MLPVVTTETADGSQHVTSVSAQERLAAALEVKLLVGFESEAGDREPVTV